MAARTAWLAGVALALLSAAGLVTALSPAFTHASNGPSAAAAPAAAMTGPAAPATRLGGWATLLRGAHDLGPSRAATTQVLVALRAARRPSSLLSWAARAGLRATWFAGQPTAMLAAPPAVLGHALGVRIDDFRLPGYGVFYASRGSGHVPAPVNGQVTGIGRITSLGQVHPGGAPAGPSVGGLGPGGFVRTYDVRPLWNRGDLGQGQTIVLFEVDGYSPSDLAAYAARFGLPAFASPLPHIGPTNGKVLGESNMDIEVAHAIAPGANLVYVNLAAFGGRHSSPAAQFQQAFSTVARQYPGAIWSISLGQCEAVFSPTDAAAANSAVRAAEQAGTTAFAASGDSGGLECLGFHTRDPRLPAAGISFPGDLPQVTSVGGTALQLTTAGRLLGQAAWTEPLLSQGSTGGQSILFSQPSWQQGPGVVSSLSSGSLCGQPSGRYCREVPDVAADAAPSSGAAVLLKGRWVSEGGTSLATPVWAALTALIDQYLRSQGDNPVGFANPLLYRLASRPPPLAGIRDVTVGTNDFFPAGPGYDMVTGLGSPDAWNLARDLASLTGRR
ncbi:MAG: Peptidase [Actinomycetia bacterium]|nr:Peptidase [Actinomycetes bacterium]